MYYSLFNENIFSISFKSQKLVLIKKKQMLKKKSHSFKAKEHYKITKIKNKNSILSLLTPGWDSWSLSQD